MYKLIGIILAAMPVVLFLRAMFMGSRKRSQAVSNFKKQVDYLVWAILVMIGCGLVFSIGKLIYDMRAIAPHPRAFDEKVESLIVDSHDGANRIQDAHWYK